MNAADFEQMVARLERESEQAPEAYKVKVALLALAGFALLAVLLSFAGLGLLLLAGLAWLLVSSGGTALILLLKLGKLLVLLAFPLWFLVKASVSALFVRLPAPRGLPVTREQAPALFAALDDMRRRMRGPRFHHVLLINEMNAAVVQRPLFGLIGFPRNYLLLGLPLLESATPDEAMAVVAHEYGHLAGAHGRFGAFIYRLRLSWGTIQAIAGQWTGWTGRLLRKPVDWYAPYFNAYTFVLARTNEYQADAASAELVGTPAAASALKRVNVSGGSYERFLSTTFASARSEGTPPDDLSERWARTALAPQAAELASKDLGEALARDPGVADTHPSLRQRLLALGVAEAALNEPPPALDARSAAAAWLGDALPLLRRDIQQQWRDDVATGWREQHQHWADLRARFQALQALPERSVDEAFELLRLDAQLRPDDDHVPAVAAFNAANPDRAGALYLEALLRLDRDDEAGLALLDRVMTLDSEATRPACERAYDFLVRRKDPRAEDYAQRWRQRADWENTREEQVGRLDPKAEAMSSGLSAEALAEVRERVAAVKPKIVEAWIARRRIPVDPDAVALMLVVRFTRWSRAGKRQEALNALVGQGWPATIHVFTEDAPYAALYKRARAAGERLI
ncbi:peptidase M48 [Roseateles chitinivorans]|uniref:Peptidase M48 n=1 Tax=Roseateles chitinivorans TaxID=2917965 RepID=A0A2G9CFS9_9BURK|nr:M48 family metallopeptidase [Roseateles chitinivorans]PIM54359.1 peptidase M48 [Roseateles chitinivorans]